MDHPDRSIGTTELFFHGSLGLVHTHSPHIQGVASGPDLGPAGSDTRLDRHHRGWR